MSTQVIQHTKHFQPWFQKPISYCCIWQKSLFWEQYAAHDCNV